MDRDGIINLDKGYVSTSEEFEFVPGIFEALKTAQDLGYLLIIVTNQSGIGREFYTQAQFDSLTVWLLDQFHLQGITITQVYHCPHAPHAGCDCRKPKPGMILQAQKDWDIDLTQSWFIGDQFSDLGAAVAAGIPRAIYKTSTALTPAERDILKISLTHQFPQLEVHTVSELSESQTILLT